MKPMYTIAELVIILARINDWEGIKVFMDVFLEEQQRYPIAHQRLVLRAVSRRERIIDLNY